MDRKIDLTERNDFSSLRVEDVLTSMFLDDELVSSDEYETIVRWESIFGKERHDNEKAEIFDYNGKYERDVERHCQRCGIELRVPWKVFYGLCKECDEFVDAGDEPLPWKRGCGTIGSRGSVGDDIQNLFGLR